MPRQPRPVVPEVPLHITQRGNNRLKCFFGESDYLVYLDLLRLAAQQTNCRIHAYALMSNHIHLLVSPMDQVGPGALMKSVNERFVQYINRRHARTGTLWEGRYRSCLVQCERYLMVCQRYIELNPVRAQIVNHPNEYRWSSYRSNAHGERNQLIAPHDLYFLLGHDRMSRGDAYRSLFDEVLDASVLDEVRFATHGNGVFGADKFTGEMEQLLGRTFSPRNRPQ